MSSKENLVTQFKATYDTPAWQPNLSDALDNLEYNHALISKDETSNSIWEIVNHLIYWNERILNGFLGIDNDDKPVENIQTFKAKDQEKNEVNWNASVDRIHKNFTQWITEVTNASEEKLESFSSKTRKTKWSETIAHLNIHNSYHIGQIVLMRKLHGNWKTKY